LVADVPGVEICRPGVHLFAGDLGWVVDETGKESCVVDFGVPEFEGKGMVGADVFCEWSELVDGNTEVVVGVYAVACHAMYVCWVF